MKYKNIPVIIVALSMLFATSCLDSVNFEPTNRYTIDLGFENDNNVELYLNSFYPILRNYSQFGDNSLGTDASMSDALTDILKYGGIIAGSGTPNLITASADYVTVANNYFDMWTSGYIWQRKIAEFLDGLDNNRGKFAVNADRYEAEARFFRAYISFLMMRNHASNENGDDLGLIIRDKLKDFSVTEKNRARSTIRDSWDYIEADLNYCTVEGRLPKSKSSGRITYYAAQALKARAMLYAERYTSAKAAALVIKAASDEFGYIDNYSEIFTNVQNKEVVYGIEYKKNILTHNFDSKFVPAGDYTSKGGYAGPSQEFVDMFDNADGTPFNIVTQASDRFITNENVAKRDPRLGASVLYNGAPWKARKIACYKKLNGDYSLDMDDYPYGKVNSPGNTITGYYMRKLLDENNLNFVVDGSYQPWCEFRYAEAILILAECYAKENNFLAAEKELGDLRNHRFGKSVVTPAFSTWNDALTVILKERCVELGFEGHRFWDLRRTRRAEQVLNGKGFNGVLWTETAPDTYMPQLHTIEFSTGTRRVFPQKYYAFPIPDAEIRNNTAARQNTNW